MRGKWAQFVPVSLFMKNIANIKIDGKPVRCVLVFTTAFCLPLHFVVNFTRFAYYEPAVLSSQPFIVRC